MKVRTWANVVEMTNYIHEKIASGGVDGATMASAQNQIIASLLGALTETEAVEVALRESLQSVLLAIKNLDADALGLAIEAAATRVAAATQAREEYAKRELGIDR